MSRQAIKEYLREKHVRYERASKEKKHTVINEIIETTGLSRKYIINILNGNITYRARTGRGKTYDGDVVNVLKSVWREAGCPCTPYFKVEIERWVEEYSTQVAVIKPEVRSLLLKMSDTTMGRLLKGEVRIKPGWSKANKRSGRSINNEIKASTPCASGESIMACEVPPGDMQLDTFALGGGDQSDNFFWILDGTDRKTQWTVLSPTWNRAQHTTLEALQRIESGFPFKILSMHQDNGGEILNHHVMAYLGQKKHKPFIWRSRPRKSNDNAHVEEKNRSSGRQLFGEIRLDCPELEKDLIEICELWSDFKNFFCPCKMLIDKVKREDGKGYRCRYDKPKTPYQRVLDEHILTPEQEAQLKARKATVNGMDLYHKVVKKLRRIKRIQADYTSGKFQPKASSWTPHLDFKRISADKKISLEFLANQTAPAYMEGIKDVKTGLSRVKAATQK